MSPSSPLGTHRDSPPHPAPETRAWGADLERNGINVIADGERRGRPRDLFLPWFAANVSVLGLSFGAWLLAYPASLAELGVAVLVGAVLSFLLVGVLSLAGQRGSAPTMVLSRAAFGVRGNVVPTAIAYLSLVGWEIVLTSLAVLMSRTVAGRLGWGDGEGAMVGAFVAVMAVTTVAGVHGFGLIMRVQGWITVATAVLTIGYLALVSDHLTLAPLVDRAPGGATAVLGLVVFCFSGLGLSWANCAADYSRYLPRNASRAGVVAWTTLGASLPIVVLLAAGAMIAGSDPHLAEGIAADPIGALTEELPTWYVIPFSVVALLGLLAGAILDIYSSGLALLVLGLPVDRWKAALLDGVLVAAGTAYVVWFGAGFLPAFQAFLLTLGVPLAAWVGVFLADLTLRRGYDEEALFDERLAYGAVNPTALALLGVGTVLGWGLVTNHVLTWQGYLLRPLGEEAVAFGASGVGVVVALAVTYVGTLLLGRGRVRAQEAGR